jgi:hypothetical protein
MNLDWRGLIAAILAGGLSMTLVLAVAGGVWGGRPLGEKGGEVMVAICVAIVSALSTYFAARSDKNAKPPSNDSHDQTYK